MNSFESQQPPISEKALANPALPSPAGIEGVTRPRLGLLAVVIVVLIALAAVAGLIPRWRQRAALRAETRELAIATVTVVYATPGNAAQALTLPAEVKPQMEAPIYARASGYLKHWLVDLGAQVETGQLLAEIDTPEINQELARARAELTEADAALGLAKITAARWAGLLKTTSVSEQETAEKQADLALKTATLGAVGANVHRLEELQSFGRVLAPFPGVITARRTEVGELIAPGNPRELFHLAQTRTLRVFVHVPQSAARGVAPGQSAELAIPELPGRVFPAKVARVSSAMTPDSRTLLTELEVDNSKGEILAGSYAQVKLTEAKLEAPLTLPANTLLFRAEGPQVGVVQANGKVELRQVTLGRDFGPTVEIQAGVSATDKVILNPADSLVSGTSVRLAEPDNKPAGR